MAERDPLPVFAPGLFAGRYANGTAIVQDGAQSLASWTDRWDPEAL